MGVLDAIKGRRSIRAFKSDDASPEIVEKAS
jgi:nitroreductase